MIFSKVSLLLLCGLFALCVLNCASALDQQKLPTIEEVLSQQQQKEHHDSEQMQGDASSSSLKDLRCYQCNSMDDAGCEANNTLKEKYLKSCPAKDGNNAIGCWKLYQRVEYDQEATLPAHSRVVRQCAYSFQEHSCTNRAGSGGAVNQCFCNTTRCNHGAGMAANPITIVGLSVLVLALFTKGWLVR